MLHCYSFTKQARCQGRLTCSTGRAHTHNTQLPGRKDVTCQAQQERSLREQHHHLHVYAISDVHCDHELNAQWVENLPSYDDASNTKRVLLIAGDVSSDTEKLRKTLIDFKQRFDVLLYVPGNHCLWLASSKDAHDDSVAKLRAVIELCAQLPGVYCSPLRLGQLVIAPTYSWHHQSWDQEPDIPGNLVPRASKLTIADYVKCEWPPEVLGPGLGDVALAEWMDSLNEACNWHEVERLCGIRSSHHTLEAGSRKPASDGSGTCQAITFSHFLPFQDLLPEKRFLTYPNLAKAVGSQPLGERILRLQPLLHVFGHSHFAWDAQSAAGIRCVQAPLCYPKERQERMRSLRMTAGSMQGSARQADCPWLPLLICTAQYSLRRRKPRKQSRQEQERLWQEQWQELEEQLDAGASGLMAACDSLQGQRSVSKGRGIRDCAEAAPLSKSTSSNRGCSLPCLLTHLHQQEEGGAVEVASWSLQACPQYHAMWSHFYEVHEREPNNTELAPWVAQQPYYRAKRRARGLL